MGDKHDGSVAGNDFLLLEERLPWFILYVGQLGNDWVPLYDLSLRSHLTLM